MSAAAPPLEVSTRAHAGTLSFEMSAGGERLIVNCGAPLTKGAEWAQATRATAAHSTLTIADTSSAPLVAHEFALNLLGPRLTPGPDAGRAKRERRPQTASGLDMSHDGYVKPFGLVHERELFLVDTTAPSSAATDRARPARPQGGAHAGAASPLRFHLHPAVRATLDAEKKTAMLALASGAAWRFETDGDLEHRRKRLSAAPATSSARRTQIVVSGTPARTGRADLVARPRPRRRPDGGAVGQTEARLFRSAV